MSRRDIEAANNEEKEGLINIEEGSHENINSKKIKQTNTNNETSGPLTVYTVMEFIGCFLSLQVSYVVWGMMQELIMNTQFKPTTLTPSGLFPSAAFCVFSNRFLAIIVSACFCMYKHGTLTSSAPFRCFAPCALSNTLSSWGQYQALAYVGFSLQTIFKSTKILPVMFMGYILKGTTYSIMEYFEALGITIGVLVFSLSKDNSTSTLSDEIIGFLLLSLYVLADSFTAQWQSSLYKDYGEIDHFQMMFGVNFSAIIITALAIVLSGEVPTIIEFLSANPIALYYNIITAITSSTGQFAIFYTIKRFGPIVFTIIMTTRQMISIVVSNYMFNHVMTIQSYIGSSIVFLVIGFCIYHKIKVKQNKKSPTVTKDIIEIEMPNQSHTIITNENQK